MKTFLINFVLFFYINYIKEDWNELKPFARRIIYPFWIIRSIILWSISPIFIIEYFWINSDMYKDMQKIMLNHLN